MTTEETLAKLVSIDSVSSRSNVEISEYLAGRCEALRFHVRRFAYTDENGVEKQNLIAVIGANVFENAEVELALVGHTDTVPFDPNWQEALTLTGRDGKLFGRGSCDTKAFIAAALAAVEALDPANLRRPLALVFTADEEIGLMGAKRLADLQPLRARYSIVGEPTSLQPIRAGKGYALAELVVKGKEAHSAYPAFGVSAIFRAARLLSRLQGIANVLESAQHDAFDPPYTTLNVGLLQGGTAKNVIPGECRFTLEWRTIPGQDPGWLLALLKSAIAEEQKLDPEFECLVNATRSDQGFETSVDAKLVKWLEKMSGKPAGTVSFGTEAAHMIRLGAEAVVFGPGNIRVAHRTGEFVPISELNTCVETLRLAILEFCT